MQSVVVPVLPDIAEQLEVSVATASWAVTAGLVSAAVIVPVFGRLADLRGGRSVLLCCLALLTAGGVVSALAPSLPLLLLGRVLQGTAGVVFPLTITVLRREVAGDRLTSAMALVSAMLGVGGGLGPVVAGLLNRIHPVRRAVDHPGGADRSHRARALSPPGGGTTPGLCRAVRAPRVRRVGDHHWNRDRRQHRRHSTPALVAGAGRARCRGGAGVPGGRLRPPPRQYTQISPGCSLHAPTTAPKAEG
ncbi:MFS transporter, partial [Nonomuraea sp. NPDC046570]|uniref:MFS transporter n=1 Tax=Nonomuraea sp. NPDC046570 TaxID=3155255 RepID=UPI0033D67753